MKMIPILASILVLIAIPVRCQATVSDVESLIQREVRAYNDRDLEAFLATYHPEVKIFRFPHTLLYTGRDEMRLYYRELFEKAPNLHVAIARRIVMGDTVIDHEKITGHIRAPSLEAVLIYKIKDGLIHRVWIMSGPEEN
jgi:hypothetical protein